MSKELGLTPEQEKQLEDYRAQNKEKVKDIHGKIKDKRKELREELQNQELDIARVAQVHSELKALEAQAEDNRLEGILKVRSILTPEQFRKFGEFTKKGKGHCGKDKHMRRKGGHMEEDVMNNAGGEE